MFLSQRKILSALFSFVLMADAINGENIGIIGGVDLEPDEPPYAALISSSGSVTPLTFSGGTAIITGNIYSVAINPFKTGLIGGQKTIGSSAPAYAALISSEGSVTALSISEPTASHGIINSVAINNSSYGIIGGRDTTGPIYAALVPPQGAPLIELSFPSPINAGGIINSVAINNSGNGLIGGQSQSSSIPAYAAIVSPSGSITDLVLTGDISISGDIKSVDNNNQGYGIIGGQSRASTILPYAALISPSGNVTPLSLNSSIPAEGIINAVAINDSRSAIIAGQNDLAAYAALISSSGDVTPISLGTSMSTKGIINAVAINDTGNAVIGGQDLTGSEPAYAALISPSGDVTPLSLGTSMDISSQILSVAIDSLGNGLIGGWNSIDAGPGYAALFTSSGSVTPLTLTGSISIIGWINSVAWVNTLPITSTIPTQFLSGNNLIFAQYINNFAPEKALYFVPSELDNNLNRALESAAPTRNGISTYTAGNNLFFLTTTFATHIRNQQTLRSQTLQELAYPSKKALPYNQLWASRNLSKQAHTDPKDSPYSIYFELIGALAHQKKQQQTPSFTPATGGTILAFDRSIDQKWRLGCGLAYLYTHIHQKNDQGHANINQEEGFIYTSWDNQKVYADILLMGGGMQIKQTRHINMTGFSFNSSSDPNGWQLIPHIELGLKEQILKNYKKGLFDLNPFIMVDWANGWQKSFEEKGNSPFNTFQKPYYGSILRTEVGCRFYETLFFDSWNFSIQEKLSYVNAQSFNGGKVNAFLVNSPGSFTVETVSSAQNLGVVQLGLNFDPIKGLYPKVNCFYQGEFGTKYQSHQINLELGWQF